MGGTSGALRLGLGGHMHCHMWHIPLEPGNASGELEISIISVL